MLDLPFKVQLCAQALCIEEMLGYPVKLAFLYFGLERRRVEVALDSSLRDMTADAIEGMHLLIRSRITPLPNYKPKKCKACSLIDLCLPTAPRPRLSASRYIASLLAEDDA
jgi:CRISPR-associated exonuclease Cas4